MMTRHGLTLAFLLVAVRCAWSQSETGLTNFYRMNVDGLRDERFHRGTNAILQVLTDRYKTLTAFPAGEHTVLLVDSNRSGTVDSIMVSKCDTNGLPADVVEVYTRDRDGKFAPVSDAELLKRRRMAAEGSAFMVEQWRKMGVTSTNSPARPAVQPEHR